MAKQYDVAIVGGGPAGIFAALELAKDTNLNVLLIEKGKDVEHRGCPIAGKPSGCVACSPCSMVSGLGGAGAFSDGKLTLSTQVGGQLKDYINSGELDKLVSYVDGTYVKFGGNQTIYGDGKEVEQLQARASLAELNLIPVPIRHLGTDHAPEIMKAMRDFLKSRIDIRLSTLAVTVLAEDGKITGVELKNGERISCRHAIVAPGREGADWLVQEAHRLKLQLFNNPIDIGVRVEVPAAVLSELTEVLYESKLEYYSPTFDDRIRTFCMCPYGEVTMESTGGGDPVTTVNGQSYESRKTGNTNFALLVSTSFTEPFKEPIAYGKYIARLANILSGGVLVQRLGDLLEGRRSTPARMAHSIVTPTLKCAVPGDLSFVLPYRHLKDIVEMLQAMDKLAPGVASRHTLLYGVEVKFYSSRLKLTENLETEIKDLFAVGDGAGVSRGLVQASASGVIAAREIARRHA